MAADTTPTDHRPDEKERGVSLPLVALSLFTLFWFAAFGVDLGWFYLNAQRIQRAADAAALAGVIWLPGSPTSADNAALEVALRNGYTDQAGDETSGVYPQVVTNPTAETELEVTIWDEVDTFFLRVFGIESQVISKKATAEYLPPLKLGSPFNTFGNDPTCYSSDPSCAGNFWANIHGQHTDTRMGDAYSSFCFDGGGSTASCDQNPSWRAEGYLYGLIPSGTSFTLQELDIAFHNKSGGVGNGDDMRTGDHNDFCSNASACLGPTTYVRVYAPDPTPTDLSDNGAPLCNRSYAPQPQVNPDDDPPFDPSDWSWNNVCTVTGAQPGAIYVVQVVMETGGSTNRDDGLNRYSLRLAGPGQLFGIRDFSLFNNATGTQTSFHLAEVPDYYAGKTFVIELYDPGDANPGGTVEVWGPDGATSSWPGGCTRYSRDEVTDGWNFEATTSTCQFSANGGTYNGDWVKLEINLPDTYSCTDCWWRINYDYPGTVQDTTTWRAYIEGNPIHLIANND